MDVSETMERATLLHRAGKLEDARRLYVDIAEKAPDVAEAWHRLGLIAQAAGKLDDAAGYMRRAAELDPRQPLYFFGLGLVLQDQNRLTEAEAAFVRALALNPDFAPAHNHLGVLCESQQRFDEALYCFREAVRSHPAYARALNNLGNLLRRRGGLAEAIDCFREAVRSSPDYRLAVANLASAQHEANDLAGAEESYRQAAALDSNDFDTWSSLGFVQIVQVRLEQAELSFRRALALKPDSPAQLNWLGYTLREQGKMNECLASFRHAAEIDSDSVQAMLGECLALPPIYFDAADLGAWRQRFGHGLAHLRRQAERLKRLPATTLLAQLQWGNFFLAYQGQNDRSLQAEYAALVADVLSAAAPEFFEPIPYARDLSKRKLRLGFLSSFLRQCTVGSYFKSWITLLNRNRFEIYVYYTGHWRDPVTQEIEASADHYARLTNMHAGEIARCIKADRLDALIYPEMGMDATGYMLGAMRLASVQCAAWGHPVTTGHNNIDYYLSCAAMEPEDAGDHYTEQPILLGGIGTCYVSRACTIAADRAGLHLPAERHLYLCPQSLYKIHPDNDEALLDILEQDIEATLVFFVGMFKTVTAAFMKRLERGLVARKLPVQKRVVFLPRMDHDGYLLVNRSCDVMLDTFHWSGGNTSLDALACALPMVTLPGSFMRGRQSLAMLKAMGLNELIARDKTDYVAIALRLGNDPAWRKEIQRRMALNFDKVFADPSPVRELERFLLTRFEQFAPI